ncbi:hypothetical protein N7E02_07415 (plasmid) [Aliirhizobium terrae]|uniref:hypothetical protein n=1 Tax=Terrirhizobium terrae TaxID=2926709 RepID=UPI0025752E93|nr:hypothetical protein [Rhizobium sp. CC-CFT758]WJH38442.1 hypothetical protein N7E02_07415 [Rhizobium sp. CC-CFT758]
MHYAVVDIGSPKQGNLGWWVTGPFSEDGGTDPDKMIAALTEAVRMGPTVLGFEATMYVPAKRDIRNTLQQRPGEAGRPWSAGAGASVTAMALALVPAILDRIAANVPGATAWQDWTRMPQKSGEILVFEAFVTTGVSNGHAEDAKLAAYAARALISDETVVSALGDEPCMSTLGAALLHSGMSQDLGELRRQCLVVKLSKTKQPQ